MKKLSAAVMGKLRNADNPHEEPVKSIKHQNIGGPSPTRPPQLPNSTKYIKRKTQT